MSPDELIRRLHEVIDTALSDSLTVENDRAAGRAEIEAIEAERREAEAVRDEVTAALRRLADVIEYAEPFAAKQFAGFAATWDAHPEMVEVVRIARGETTSHEDRRER